MIVEFNNEFQRIATVLNCGYVNKSVSELEDYVQGYDFAEPLINFLPVKNVKSEIGASGQIMWEVECKLQMLTKASKSDNFEAVKNVLINEMIYLQGQFFWELNKNENFVFNTPVFRMPFSILNQYTANFLVGIENSISFNTSFNRLH